MSAASLCLRRSIASDGEFFAQLSQAAPPPPTVSADTADAAEATKAKEVRPRAYLDRYETVLSMYRTWSALSPTLWLCVAARAQCKQLEFRSDTDCLIRPLCTALGAVAAEHTVLDFGAGQCRVREALAVLRRHVHAHADMLVAVAERLTLRLDAEPALRLRTESIEFVHTALNPYHGVRAALLCANRAGTALDAAQLHMLLCAQTCDAARRVPLYRVGTRWYTRMDLFSAFPLLCDQPADAWPQLFRATLHQLHECLCAESVMRLYFMPRAAESGALVASALRHAAQHATLSNSGGSDAEPPARMHRLTDAQRDAQKSDARGLVLLYDEPHACVACKRARRVYRAAAALLRDAQPPVDLQLALCDVRVLQRVESSAVAHPVVRFYAAGALIAIYDHEIVDAPALRDWITRTEYARHLLPS